ncbi:Nephrin-like 11, partial [Homarus americanus]
YDVRELLGGQPKHWWDAELLGSRAFFNAGSAPSHLLLQVPPRRLVLVEESGAEVRNYVGPINEGNDLHLSCVAHGVRPLDVIIHHPREPLSASRTYEVLCSSRGSRPPAVLTWWWGSSRVPAADDTTSHGGNVSSSMVRLTPNASDDGRLLACRAENHNLPTAGVVVRDEREGGVLVTNRSLVVQEVTRSHAGHYTCQASNVEGDSSSPPISLAVQYVPLCRPGQVTVYGVSKLEKAQVTCQVDAVPQVTRFFWTFNNTAESLEVPRERFTESLGGRTVVVYTPMSDLDYGTLLCSSENMVGRQAVPCVFHIIPATQPESPTNCSLHNVSANSLTVECEPGFDGGLNQTFAMEVYGTNPHTLKANITSKLPRFVVIGLDNESEFQLIVYAGNAKGRSGITRLVAITHKLPVKQLETRLSSGDSAGVTQDTLAVEVTPLLGVLAGIVLVLAVIAVVIIVILRVQCSAAARRRQAHERGNHKNGDKQQRKQEKRSHAQQHKTKQQYHEHQHQPSLKKSHGSHSEEVHSPVDDLHDCYREQHLRQHVPDDQSPDVVACSGDCDEVSVSIRPGGALSFMPGHRHTAQHHHLQQLHHAHTHQQSPPQPVSHHNLQQCQQQHSPALQHLHQQHSPSLGQHSQQQQSSTQPPHSYTLPLSGHGTHDLRHAHLTQAAYSTAPRVCGGADIEVHFAESGGDSGTPPAPAPDHVSVPHMYKGDGAPTQGVTTGLARIPEDPESPASGRRESAKLSEVNNQHLVIDTLTGHDTHTRRYPSIVFPVPVRSLTSKLVKVIEIFQYQALARIQFKQKSIPSENLRHQQSLLLGSSPHTGYYSSGGQSLTLQRLFSSSMPHTTTVEKSSNSTFISTVLAEGSTV